ncbi:MAG: DUF3857 domain-containing protein [Thermoanaerobaculia bacterium]
MRRLPLLLSLLAILLPAPGALAAGRPFSVAPPPDWITRVDLPATKAEPAGQISDGTWHLLVDDQIRIGRTTERWVRRARKIVSSSGVRNFSELHFDFDPTWQSLTIHFVDIIRDGRRIRAFSPEQVRVIERERDRSERMYDGTLTALFFLRDLRPGDIVDYAYSLRGANPILHGRFAGELDLGYQVPVARLYARALIPAGRTITPREFQSKIPGSVRREGTFHSWTWAADDVPAIEWDSDTPVWFDPFPRVELSEFRDWNEVARWASDLFDHAGNGGSRMTALARSIATGESTDEGKVLAAVRFVQDQIRYLGIEIGPNTHQPHPPDQVLRQRFGDCKDKALLLTVLLQKLGFQARPALVNTTARETLDEVLPSPFAFDHVIVHVVLDGRSHWIDATRSDEGGSLDALAPPDFGRALLVDRTTTALVPIPPPEMPRPTTSIEEIYRVGEGGAGAELEVKSVYTGEDADDMRGYFDSTSNAELARNYVNHYAQFDAKVTALERPVVKDDRSANRIVVTERYSIPSFWKNHRRDLFAWAMDDWLSRPASVQRSGPYGLIHPAHVVHEIRVELPRRLSIHPEHLEVDDPAFRFWFDSTVSERMLRLRYRYRSLSDSVPRKRIPEFLDHVDKARAVLDYELRDDVPAPVAASMTPSFPVLAGGVAIVSLLILGGALFAGWKLASSFAQRGGGTPRRSTRLSELKDAPDGRTPASPIPVSGSAEVGALLAVRPCPCGAEFPPGSEMRQTARYLGHPLTIVSRRCQQCSQFDTVYFRTES